jgi:hypothetical protein
MLRNLEVRGSNLGPETGYSHCVFRGKPVPQSLETNSVIKVKQSHNILMEVQGERMYSSYSFTTSSHCVFRGRPVPQFLEKNSVITVKQYHNIFMEVQGERMYSSYSFTTSTLDGGE